MATIDTCMRHLPNKPYLIGLICFLGIVLSVGVTLTFWANGYRLLTNPLRLVKTGVISLEVHPAQGIMVQLNQQSAATSSTVYADLTPGRYTITVTRDQFFPWTTTVDLAAGKAVRLEDIVLFYREPIQEEIIETTRIAQFDAILRHPERFQYGLQILDNELWAFDHLVTRYSQPISSAYWLPDEAHVIASVAGDIHVMDLDGQNDRVILKVPPATQVVRLAPISGGQKLVLDIDGLYQIYTVTEPYSFLPF